MSGVLFHERPGITSVHKLTQDECAKEFGSPLKSQLFVLVKDFPVMLKGSLGDAESAACFLSHVPPMVQEATQMHIGGDNLHSLHSSFK